MTLREILKKHGIKQSVVAEALGIAVTNLSRYDDLSKRTIREIKIIAEATGIDVYELTGGRPLDVGLITDNIRNINEQLIKLPKALLDADDTGKSMNDDESNDILKLVSKILRLERSLDLAYKEIDRLNEMLIQERKKQNINPDV